MGSSPEIPQHRPILGQAEQEALAACLAAGRLDGDGPICRQVEACLRELTGSAHVLLTGSATAALELGLQLLQVGPGHEVICPSWTYPSTANAVLRCGARPVFADVDEDHLCLDPADVARVASDKTRCVLPVAYGGVDADLPALRQASGGPGVSVLLDAAHGLLARRDGRHLGLDADAAALSFHATKNVTSGEGGALLLQDDALARRAEVLREKGTNRAAFLRGEVPRYEWVDLGTSGGLSELLAALLSAQLPQAQGWTGQRRQQVAHYDEALAAVFESGQLRPQGVPAGCTPNGHLYTLRTTDEGARTALAQHLAAAGIESPIHFVPLHTSAFARQQLGPQRALPVTERVGATLLRLPLGPHLRAGDQERVIAALLSWLGRG